MEREQENGGYAPEESIGDNLALETGAQVEKEPEGRVPRIYVASLSDYNAGRLHGVWLDATEDYDTLSTGVAQMLAASPEPGAEDRAVVVIDPKGDLIDMVLARVPDGRRDEVVVLDPADDTRPGRFMTTRASVVY
jgi:hypothetical protein